MMEDSMRKRMCIYMYIDTYTHTLGHFAVQEKLAQHCKSTIFKKKKKGTFAVNDSFPQLGWISPGVRWHLLSDRSFKALSKDQYPSRSWCKEISAQSHPLASPLYILLWFHLSSCALRKHYICICVVILLSEVLHSDWINYVEFISDQTFCLQS